MKVSSLENHWAQVGFSSTPLLEYRVPEGFCWHSMGKKWGINVGDPVTIGIRSDLRIFQWWLDLGSIGYFICVIMLYQSMIIMWLSLCCDYHVIILVSLYHVVSLYDHNPWGSGGLGQTYCHWGAKSLGLREGALGKTNMARMVGLEMIYQRGISRFASLAETRHQQIHHSQDHQCQRFKQKIDSDMETGGFSYHVNPGLIDPYCRLLQLRGGIDNAIGLRNPGRPWRL